LKLRAEPVSNIFLYFGCMEQTISLQEIIARYPFFLHYKGNYKDNLTLKIVDIVEANLSLYFKKFIVNRLAYMVVEAVQNVERYSAHNGTSEDFCYVFSDYESFHVITQNRIENSNIPGLKARLDHVNSKNHEELNKIYHEVLASDTFTTKGAGLGLIDMARKSKNTLLYEFFPIDNLYSAYRLHVKIPIHSTANASHLPGEDNTPILIKELDALFKANRSTLFYSGDFSNTFLQSLLKMIGNFKKTENLPVNSVFNYTVIELNQNLKRHAKKIDDKIPGFLCLEWQDAKAFISTYNYLEDKDALALEKKITHLNGSSLEGLKEESKEFLTNFSLKGGLGLIDIVRLNWPNKIESKFERNPKFGQSIHLKIQFDYS